MTRISRIALSTVLPRRFDAQPHHERRIIVGIGASVMPLTPAEQDATRIPNQNSLGTPETTFDSKHDYFSGFYREWKNIFVELNFQTRCYLSRQFCSHSCGNVGWRAATAVARTTVVTMTAGPGCDAIGCVVSCTRSLPSLLSMNFFLIDILACESFSYTSSWGRRIERACTGRPHLGKLRRVLFITVCELTNMSFVDTRTIPTVTTCLAKPDSLLAWKPKRELRQALQLILFLQLLLGLARCRAGVRPLAMAVKMTMAIGFRSYAYGNA